MTTKYCNCYNCKHPESHLTSYHTCGKCGDFGHGFAECDQNHNGSYDHINKLVESNYIKTLITNYPVPTYNAKLKFTELPKEKHCTIQSCKSKHTHQTQSHQPFFSKDEYGGANGPDKYGITARYNKIILNGKIIENLPNTYIAMYWGMGNMIVFRNRGGKVEKLETEGDYTHFVNGLKEIKEPSINKCIAV